MRTTRPTFRFHLPRLPWWLGAILFAAVAVFFLWEEHAAHILGALPWLLLLTCALLHIFMHHGHGGGATIGDPKDERGHHQGGAR